MEACSSISRIQELDSQGTITKRPTLGIITDCRSILRKHVFLGGSQKIHWQNFESLFQTCHESKMKSTSKDKENNFLGHF